MNSTEPLITRLRRVSTLLQRLERPAPDLTSQDRAKLARSLEILRKERHAILRTIRPMSSVEAA